MGPLVARAQQPERMRCVVLAGRGADDLEGQARLAAFRKELAAANDDGSAGSKTGRPEEEAVTAETIPAEFK